MTKMSLFPLIPSTDLTASRDFYRDLLGMRTTFEADWYVSMISEDGDAQIAFIAPGHDSVPDAYHAPAAGVLVTVEVADVDEVHERARSLGLPMVYDLRSEV